MLFGVNAHAPVLLKILGTDPYKVPRFRDCYVSPEDDEIVIHTRTGGGNRDYYESAERCRESYPHYFEEGKEPPTGPWNSDLRALPGFLRDADDDFDCTYADFHYSFPPEFAAELKALRTKDETVVPSEKWKKLFESFPTPPPT